MDHVVPAARNEASSSSTVKRFTLSGPSADLDPRYHAYRGDLADVALASRLFAPHYADPSLRLTTKATTLRAEPHAVAEALGEMLPGEAFAMLDITGGWAWGYRASDHLVAYLPAADLTAGG